MSCLNKELGKEGENLAVEYLKEQGYEIIARNVTMGKNGEIDIIALKDDIYAFVEVRSRSTDDYIDPESTITAQKRKKIIRTAEAYIDAHDLENHFCRLDVIAIVFDGARPHLSHIEDAFTK